jgi:hypothetical protein
LKNIALASEDSKVRHTRFFTGKEPIRCLLQELVKIEAIDGMTSRVYRLHPKAIESLVFIKHGSCPL